MSVAALVISLLALVASVVAILVGVRLARLDRAATLSAALTQVQLDKSLVLKDEARLQVLDALQRLESAISKTQEAVGSLRYAIDANGAAHAADEWLEVPTTVDDELREAAAELTEGIWRFRGALTLAVRPIDPFSYELADALDKARSYCWHCVVELQDAARERAVSGAGPERLLRAARAADGLSACAEFIMDVRFMLELFFQNEILGFDDEIPEDPPYVFVRDGIWVPNWKNLPDLASLLPIDEGPDNVRDRQKKTSAS